MVQIFVATGLMILSANHAEAKICRFVHLVQSAEVLQIVQEDSYIQWLRWEQTANLEQYRQPLEPTLIPVVRLHSDQVIVETTQGIDPHVLGQFVSSSGQIAWPKHPHNTEYSVPFARSPESDSFRALRTASRSLALLGKLRGYTVKLPTNRPFGPHGEIQRPKALTADDVLPAIVRSQMVLNRDQILGPDETLVVLPEVMTLSEAQTRHGFVLRDVRQLDDGHYYLPALSIPYVGREIAAHNRADFDGFFERYFAAALGEAKARFLLRYGLQLETPNPQNILLQFDRELRPTGKIVFRDVSDAFMVKPVAESLGFQDQIVRERDLGYEPVSQIRPEVSNSMWRLDEAEDFSVDGRTLSQWSVAHNEVYIKTLESELRLEIGFTRDVVNQDNLPRVYRILDSVEGRRAISEWNNRNSKPTPDAF